MGEDNDSDNDDVLQLRRILESGPAGIGKFVMSGGSQSGSIASGSCTNIEEDYGVVKSSLVTAGFAPVKKERLYYAVLSERALELHESEKTYRRRKTAKHIIDLATAFNVHNDHLDPKLRRCTCVMAPDETLVMRGETKQLTDEWYMAILTCMIPSRALHLGRPVMSYEFFEYAWDVEVVTHIKTKKHRDMAGYVNMTIKLPQIIGKRRLCFYSHTVLVANRRLEPTMHDCPESGFPPFREEGFIELPRTFIAFFGCHEKHFFLRMGRGSVMGGSELLCTTDSEEMAQEIHQKLSDIIDRETEKKKKMNVPDNYKPRYHRDRSYTGSYHSGTDCDGESRERKRSRRQSNTYRHVKEEEGLIEAMKQANLATYRCAETPTPSEKSGKKRKTSVISKSSSIASASNSIMESIELEDGEESFVIPATPKADEKMELDGKKTPEPERKDREEKKPETGKIELRSVSGTPTSRLSVNNDDNYSMMEATDWNMTNPPQTLLSVPFNFVVPVYHLDEARTYISDSVDSCYDSMADKNSTASSQPPNPDGITPPRANSFGGRSNEPQKPVVRDVDATPIPKANLSIPADDPRKRAFSVGSKSFLNFLPDFRKLMKKQVLARPSSPNTSASGLSLTSSAASPASTSTHHLISDDDARNRFRSGSFGSGRSSPFGRHSYLPPAPTSHHRENDHHVEFDFGHGGGRSGSGSIASMDGSSRTSSFGCSGMRKEDLLFSHFHEQGAYDIPTRPSEIVLARQRSEGDYVLQDPSKINSQAPAELARMMEPRNSKVFETIQEAPSTKSSRSSSRTSIGAEEEIVKRSMTLSHTSPATSPSNPTIKLVNPPYSVCSEYALKTSYCSSIAEEREDVNEPDFVQMDQQRVGVEAPKTNC